MARCVLAITTDDDSASAQEWADRISLVLQMSGETGVIVEPAEAIELVILEAARQMRGALVGLCEDDEVMQFLADYKLDDDTTLSDIVTGALLEAASADIS